MDALTPGDVERIRTTGGPPKPLRRGSFRIESDGTPMNTRVFDATGHEVKGLITAIDIQIRPSESVMATLTFAAVELSGTFNAQAACEALAREFATEKNASRL